MASYWKSNPRYFCETCKCWLSDNKASIEFHERGKSHKEKKEKQIAALRKRSAAEFKDQQKAGQYLREMEDAALLAYKKDLAKRGAVLDNTMPDLAGSRPSTGLHEYHFIDDPSKKKKIKIHNADEFKKKSKTLCWTKQVSPEGREYYWNSETGISQWEKPEGYVDIFPPNPTGESSSNLPGASRSSKNLKSSWIKQVSPDGDTYYWNTETGTSRWEKPEGFIEKSEGNSKTDLQGNKSGEISGKAPVEEAKSLWTEEVSPEGRTYYWNKESGKSQWEKPDDYVPPKAEFTPVVDDKDGEEPGESPAPAKKPRHNPYGVWTTVQQPKTTRNINWQLPVKPPDCAKEGVVDRTALENSYEPEPQKFNEKIVTSLGDDEGGSTVFKKKKSKQRSIRKRNDDD